MKIFITGATGFIGTYLCKRLVEEGHDLTVLLRTPAKRKLLPRGTTILNGDLSLFQDKNLELPEFDYVIHLAAAIFAKTRRDYYRLNFDAVKDLVHCLENQSWKPKRFLFASSLAAAGASNGREALTEDMPLNPVDYYGDAKRMAEEFLDTISFPATSFRPAIVLGAGDENSLTLFKMAKKGRGVKVRGIDQVVSFVDIDDLIDAMVLMMEDERPAHQRFFVSHPQTIAVSELWESLGKGFNKKLRILPVPKSLLYTLSHLSGLASVILPFKNQLDYKQYKQMTTPAFVCSGEKLQKELQWNPSNDLDKTIVKAIAGYKELNML